IGTNAAGNAKAGNKFNGIFLSQPDDVTIGGFVAGAGNLISGNLNNGISISSSGDGSKGALIVGNKIGTDVSGTADLGNALNGIRDGGHGAMIGGATDAATNIIAFNGLAGVAVIRGDIYIGDRNTIRHNSIFSNGGLGIDLEDSNNKSGVTDNDLLDADTGIGNDGQNSPVLASASSNGNSVTISGALNSKPNEIFLIDFYANDAVDQSGYGEGKQYIGTTSVTTDGNGNASFNSTFNVALGAS